MKDTLQAGRDRIVEGTQFVAGWGDEMRNRVPLKASGPYIDQPEQLVGVVMYLVPRDGKDCSKGAVYTRDFYARTIKAECDTAATFTGTNKQENRLHDYVNGGFEVGGTYIIGGANLVNKVTWGIDLIDVMRKAAPKEKCLPTDWRKQVAAEPAPAVWCAADWVQGISLTQVAFRRYTEFGAGIQVTGAAFGGNGKVWAGDDFARTDYMFGGTMRPLIRKNEKGEEVVMETLAGDQEQSFARDRQKAMANAVVAAGRAKWEPLAVPLSE